MGGTPFNPYAYFGHSWSYFDIQNLRLVILYMYLFFFVKCIPSLIFVEYGKKAIQANTNKKKFFSETT